MPRPSAKPPPPAPRPDGPSTAKPGLHPRNRHREGYDFPALVQADPGLAAFLTKNPAGGTTVDFADPGAVRALNRALLRHHYGVQGWELPPGFLCPPIPGRADYLHHAADLLAGDHGGRIPCGESLRVLDIGTGASAVYALLGHAEYGWSFVGSESEPRALAAAAAILAANPDAARRIELRRQRQPGHILQGLLKPGESFALSLCNPPFHASPEEARAGSARKWRNLKGSRATGPVLNFGGQGGELWCPGGEAAFVGRLIAESGELRDRVLWYTSLVSKAENLPALRRALRQAGALEVRILPMAQGQKRSRILAWTFVPPASRPAWFGS